MLLNEKFVKSLSSDDGFFSIKKNTRIYKQNSASVTPWAIGLVVSFALGLSPVSALCIFVIFLKVMWFSIFKHLARFCFTVYYTECDGHGKVIYEKPFPKWLRIFPEEPFK